MTLLHSQLDQNTSSTKGQIRYLVYCMENAILNLAADQEQMVWLIDFQGWTMASITIKVTRETAHVLQDYYPERLALAILYNPPRIFESFWKVPSNFLSIRYCCCVMPATSFINFEGLGQKFHITNAKELVFKIRNMLICI